MVVGQDFANGQVGLALDSWRSAVRTKDKKICLRKKKIISFKEWAEIIDTIWPDLTEEDLAMWNYVGVTFKMRRRYEKFVLLYYMPRFPYSFEL